MDFGSGVFALVFLSAALLPLSRAGARVVEGGLKVVDAVAARRVAAPLLCALLAFIGCMAVAHFVMWPEPRIHDEFSYILAGDTFAHGRLTNPTHPLWQHFESFHIFHEPTYASKYPPAQGAMLAIGILLTGQPIVGVWLSSALMCGAICWMLRGLVSPRWALLGGIAATMQVGIANTWTQTYWGGAVAAAAGAVVVGAAVRVARDARPRDALVLGCGLVILANSRPFEGAIMSLPVAAYLAILLWRDRPRWLRSFVPLTVTLAIGLAAMAAYNQTVTGRWWLPPYIHHEQLYTYRPTLSFMSTHTPTAVYRNPEMEHFYTGKTGAGEPTPASPLPTTALNTQNLWKTRTFFLGRALLLPFCVGLFVARRRADGRMLAATLACGLATLLLLRYFQVHYIAPITATVFALIGIGLERLDRWRPGGKPVGTGLCIASLVTALGGLVGDIGRVPNIHTAFGHDDTAARRARTVSELLASPGRDLVIVQYGPSHDPHREWVYNAADIDASQIVWARDMGEQRNRELLDYFADRHVWVLREGFADERDGLTQYVPPPAGGR